MGSWAIQAASAGFVLLLGLAVWLAFRLKKKNKQLKKALGELERRPKPNESQSAPKPHSVPIVASTSPAPIAASKPEPAVIADAFLWEHLSDDFLWNHPSNDKPPIPEPEPAELTLGDSLSIPTGLCDRTVLQPVLDADLPFTGLVVLVGIASRRTPRFEDPVLPFIKDLLSPADFACRNGADEFLIVCPGLKGAEAQRRLNEISERLWNFQLRGQGSLSVLFSWGGIGAENESLSDSIASAIERMQQTKRNRVLLFRRKAG